MLLINVNPLNELQVEVARAVFAACAALRAAHGAARFGLRLAISYDNAAATTAALLAADFALVCRGAWARVAMMAKQ